MQPFIEGVYGKRKLFDEREIKKLNKKTKRLSKWMHKFN